MILAAADGSSLANPGPSGWAWYIDDSHWAAGGWPRATNNIGELMAVLDLLRATKDVDEPIRILCDSQYVINCCTRWIPAWKKRGWRKADNKPVLNLDLLKELDAELAGRKVGFQWVRGHTGHPLNEKADTLARAAATAYQQGTPVAAGPGFSTAAVHPSAYDQTSTADMSPADTAEPVSVPADQNVSAKNRDKSTSRRSSDHSTVSSDHVILPKAGSETLTESPAPDHVILPQAGSPKAEDGTRARPAGMDPLIPLGEHPEPLSAQMDPLVPLPPDPIQRSQPDLLSAAHPLPKPISDTSVVVDLTELTRELMDDETQLDRERLDELMHPDFVAHMPTGIIRTKGSIMARPYALSGSIQLNVLGADFLGNDYLLLRYKLKRNSQDYLCAILWQRVGRSWQARFQQLTTVDNR